MNTLYIAIVSNTFREVQGAKKTWQRVTEQI